MAEKAYLDKLIEFLSIPSVGTLPEHKKDMQKAAAFLERELAAIGFRHTGLHTAKGCAKHPPIVYGERIDNPKKKTILLYGHYDVQPVDPLNQWKTPPFEPHIVNGAIYARGATDDKGQIMTHIAALSQLSHEWGSRWPVNIKVIFEGEEESGGTNLHAWLAEKETQSLLKADICIASDTGFRTNNTPAIVYGLRGIVYFQIDVKLADHDLHSGAFGGTVLNPINALVHLLNQLYDAQTGRILIPGFYDDVAMLTAEERALLANVPFDEEKHLQDGGNAVALHGEQHYSHKERLTVRPSFDINGIWGGFIGAGIKTIIPATAHAKFSSRLVPHQRPEKIAQLVEKYLMHIAPRGIKVGVSHLQRSDGVIIDRKSVWMQAAVSALEETFGHQVVFDRSGASIPVIAEIKKYLGIDTLLFGYSLPDDNLHAPNEKYSLQQLEKGIAANKLFYTKVASGNIS